MEPQALPMAEVRKKLVRRIRAARVFRKLTGETRKLR